MSTQQAATNEGRRSRMAVVVPQSHRASVTLFAFSLMAAACEPGLTAPENPTSPAANVITSSTLPLQIVVTDPAADNTGHIDVLQFVLRFDNVTGAYEIDIATSPTAPFTGNFRINVNLFNVDASSFFQDVVNDYNLSSPTTNITLTGTSSALTSWVIGDRVHTNSLFGTPNPPGSSQYRTAVNSFPLTGLTNEDYIAFTNGAQPAIVEPATPQAAVQFILEEVSALAGSGDITANQASGLTDKLNAILDKIAAGQTQAAINQLTAFVNQVNALVNGGLDAQLGQVLVDAANDAIDLLAL